MLITGCVTISGAGTVGAPLYVLGVRFMLQTLDSEISECYLHAAKCSCSAAQSRDPLTKQDFLDMQRRWLCLAHSYEFAELLWNFTEPFRRRNRQKIQEATLDAPASSHSNQSKLIDRGSAEKEYEYAELV